jgi:hypothetical protein
MSNPSNHIEDYTLFKTTCFLNFFEYLVFYDWNKFVFGHLALLSLDNVRSSLQCTRKSNLQSILNKNIWNQNLRVLGLIGELVKDVVYLWRPKFSIKFFYLSIVCANSKTHHFGSHGILVVKFKYIKKYLKGQNYTSIIYNQFYFLSLYNMNHFDCNKSLKFITHYFNKCLMHFH